MNQNNQNNTAADFDMYVCNTVQTRYMKRNEDRLGEAIDSGFVTAERGEVQRCIGELDEEEERFTRMLAHAANKVTVRTKVLSANVTVRR